MYFIELHSIEVFDDKKTR